MPIQIPNDLPAAGILQNENIFVMPQTRAETQEIRPLEIVLLNLMPTKIVTETQLSRLLGNTPLQVHLELMMISSHKSKNTPQEHLLNFYKTFDELKDRKFDGMVITGAPVELLPLSRWTTGRSCAALWSGAKPTSTPPSTSAGRPRRDFTTTMAFRSTPCGRLQHYPHHADYKRAILLRGFDDEFWIPHSRHTTVYREDIEKIPELKILASSEQAGVYALMNKEGRQIFVTGHSEYDADTLEKEYLRDKNQGLPIHVPANYYPNDDDTQPPMVRWRGHGNLLYSNWLNYFVYQTTPYDIMAVGQVSQEG